MSKNTENTTTHPNPATDGMIGAAAENAARNAKAATRTNFSTARENLEGYVKETAAATGRSIMETITQYQGAAAARGAEYILEILAEWKNEIIAERDPWHGVSIEKLERVAVLSDIFDLEHPNPERDADSIAWLLEHGYIRISGDNYYTTPKGQEYLSAFDGFFKV